MKKIVLLLVSLVIIVSLCASLFTGCTVKRDADTITIPTLSIDDVNYSHLEVKADNKIALVEGGITSYSIYIDSEINKSLRDSVDTLSDVIYEMSGARLEVTNSIKTSNTIYIGEVSSIDTSDVQDDGFRIVVGDDIHIKGQNYKATRNGVYHFIEEYLGVMFIRYDDTYIPKHSAIYIEKDDRVFNPATIWRDVYSKEVTENGWSAKLKLNSIDVESSDEELIAEAKREGKEVTEENRNTIINEMRQYDEWGTWCHSYYQYLSPEEYFDSHPEYFSLKDGKRIHTYNGIDAHLCLSNPDVYDIVEKSLDEKIEAHPEVKYWDFSANDNYEVKGCECSECKKLDKKAGKTGMGTLLPFLNKLARHVKEKYPDREIYISTLAYLHTLKVPKDMEVEDNVVIKLCSMPGDQATTYGDPGNKEAKEFHDQLKGWSEITDKIVVWDYVVDFANLLLPFPNLAVQGKNQQFYEENNVQGIFHQASRERGGEMTHLKDYILSKLMWEGSSMDVATEVARYIYAYYGEGAEQVIEYINAMQSNLTKSGKSLGLYDQNSKHFNGYLSKENVELYEGIINEAIDKVKDDEKYLSRVEEVKLNILMAKMLLPNISKEERRDIKDDLVLLSDKQGVTMISEWEKLKTFNDDIENRMSSIAFDSYKDNYISIIIVGAVALVGTIIAVITVFIIRKKKNKKSDTK